MSLLGDFLAGVAAGVPRVVDDIERRRVEEERLRAIEQERAMQRQFAEDQYNRQRNDRLSDVTADRAYAESQRQAEDLRVQQGNERFASGYAASRNQVSPEQARAVGRGGLLTGVIEGEAPMDGMGPGAPTQGVDTAKMKKVFGDFHAALSTAGQGKNAKEVMGVLKEREDRQAFDALDDNGKAQWARNKQLQEGKDPALVDARIAALEAQKEAAEARARDLDRGPAPRTEKPESISPERKQQIANVNSDLSDARRDVRDAEKNFEEAAAKVRSDKSPPAYIVARDEAKKNLDAARKRRDELIAERDSLSGGSKTTDKPAYAGLPPGAKKIGTSGGKAVYELPDGSRIRED